MKLRLAFFGTPEFSGDLLDKLINNDEAPVEVMFVVTQPDRPIGRKKNPTPSPVKQVAQKHSIKIFESLDIPDGIFKSIDIALIYYYGKIIPLKFLKLPRLGFWNIHFSRLPQYRGATPATFSLIMGDPQTAVSLVYTDEKLDHGPLISQDFVSIDSNETRLELEQKLHDALPAILGREMKDADNFKSRLKQQDHSKATYTVIPTRDHGFIPLSVLKKTIAHQPLSPDELPALILDYLKKNKKDYGYIDMKNSAKIIFDYYRGLHTWPGIWTLVNNKRMKIIDAELENNLFTIKTMQFEGGNSKPFSDKIFV